MTAHLRETVLTLLFLSFSVAACVGNMDSGSPDPDQNGGTPGGSGGAGSDDVGDDPSQPAGDDDEDLSPTTVCAPGEDAIYQPADEVSAGNENFTSGVRGGSGGTPMIITCGQTNCADGQVGVEIESDPFLGGPSGVQCVEAPPGCPGGTSPFWVQEVTDPEDPFSDVGGFWTCSSPCEVIVDFGGLYGFQSACTTQPPDCPGSTPTFLFESHEWTCAPMCDGGLYDPVEWQGETVCVPC